MNKIVFSGIEIHDLWADGLTWANRLDKIKEAITEIINVIDSSGTYHVGYVRHLNFRLKGARQIFEVTMGSEVEAKALRKAYGAKVKTWRSDSSFPEEIKGISLAPDLTLATRVRDIFDRDFLFFDRDIFDRDLLFFYLTGTFFVRDIYDRDIFDRVVLLTSKL